MSPQQRPGAPDMTGVRDDVQRALEARKRAERPADQWEEDDDDAVTPRGHDATERPHSPAEGPRARSRVKAPRQAPAVATARAMTVRMEPDEADDVDQYVLNLRAETGQRLDKAEVVRELLRLAQHNPAVHRALVKRLR